MNIIFLFLSSKSESVSAMTFGRLGQEDYVLVLVTVEGQLIIKILKRTADFKVDQVDTTNKPNTDQVNNLQIPKKTKVFVEQTIRERESGPCKYCFMQWHGQ